MMDLTDLPAAERSKVVLCLFALNDTKFHGFVNDFTVWLLRPRWVCLIVYGATTEGKLQAVAG